MRMAGLALAWLVLPVISVGCGNIDVLTASYATLDEARRAGAIERGWIPTWLPPGAHDLREAHDDDSNRRWGLFNFDATDEPALREAVGAPISLEGRSCEAPRRIEWWPVMLRGRLRAGPIEATGLVAYAAREPEGLIVAVNWKQRRSYYWTDSR